MVEDLLINDLEKLTNNKAVVKVLLLLAQKPKSKTNIIQQMRIC